LDLFGGFGLILLGVVNSTAAYPEAMHQHNNSVKAHIADVDAKNLTGPERRAEVEKAREELCQEDAQASCCTKDGGGPFGAAL
jgi:hypothetical protein